MKIWEATYSEGVTLDKNQGGCSFVMPNAPGHINYLLSGINPDRFATAQALSVYYKTEIVSGRPKFVSLDGTGPMLPGFNLMIEAEDDNMRSEFGRYWSKPRAVLLPNTVASLHVPLAPGLWSDVEGKPSTEHLPRWAGKRIGKLGITFGGGNSYGHGLTVLGGVVRFTLSKLVLH